MLKDLVKLANHLDSKGLEKEADALDSVIRKIAGSGRRRGQSGDNKEFEERYKSPAGYDTMGRKECEVCSGNGSFQRVIKVNCPMCSGEGSYDSEVEIPPIRTEPFYLEQPGRGTNRGSGGRPPSWRERARDKREFDL